MSAIEQLLDAIENRYLKIIREILKRDNGSLAALGIHTALNGKDETIANFIRTNNKSKRAAISKAMINGYTNNIDYELLKGKDIVDIGEIAASIGDIDMIKYLEGKNIPHKDLFYEGILEKAIEVGNTDVIHYAVKHGAIINDNTILVAIMGNSHILQYLLDISGISPTSEMVDEAIKHISPDTLRVLLENGAIPEKIHLKKALHIQEFYPEYKSIKEIIELLRDYMPRKLQ